MTYYEKNGQTRSETWRTLLWLTVWQVERTTRQLWRGRATVLFGALFALAFFMLGHWS